MLTEAEREHLFMLGLGRPPEVRYKAANGVTPRLQRVLDALEFSPAIVKTATWDVVGWNKAAAALITDYSKLPREERNILRLMFGSRTRVSGRTGAAWHASLSGRFAADVARAGAGASEEVCRLVEEVSRLQPGIRSNVAR